MLFFFFFFFKTKLVAGEEESDRFLRGIFLPFLSSFVVGFCSSCFKSLGWLLVNLLNISLYYLFSCIFVGFLTNQTQHLLNGFFFWVFSVLLLGIIIWVFLVPILIILFALDWDLFGYWENVLEQKEKRLFIIC